jgi:hypothetical protein
VSVPRPWSLGSSTHWFWPAQICGLVHGVVQTSIGPTISLQPPAAAPFCFHTALGFTPFEMPPSNDVIGALPARSKSCTEKPPILVSRLHAASTLPEAPPGAPLPPPPPPLPPVPPRATAASATAADRAHAGGDGESARDRVITRRPHGVPAKQ